jgi:hypothetical protein
MWWLVAGFAVVVSVFAAVYPMMVIQPFRPQEQGALAVALAVREWAPFVTALSVAVAIWAVVRLWPSGRWFARAGAILLACLCMAAAVFSRVNIFERMFAPIGEVALWSASEAELDPDDMVMAVHFAGQARAYPVRMMAYHHVVNDWVGGVPLVGTY